MAKFCINSFFQAQNSWPKGPWEGFWEYWRSLWYIRPALPAPIIPCLQLCFFMVRSAFVGISLSIRRSKESKTSCFGSSSRLSFKRVLFTQRLSGILSRIEKVYNWASYLKHLWSIEFDANRALESPNLFDFFKKNVSFWSRFRWNKAREN